MPHPRLASLLLFSLLAGVARADLGFTLSLQTDARDRGMSYSDNRPSGQLGVSWDGAAGWYAGASLGEARFTDGDSAWLRVYGGRVVSLAAGLNGEFGLLAHRFDKLSSYDFAEAYVGLLGERWSLRLYASPDYYGIGQHSLYAEANGRWPLGTALPLTAIAHAGVLRGFGGPPPPPFAEPRRSTRVDLRAGVSWPWREAGEWQLVWTAASRGGPYTWTDASRRRAVSLNFSLGF